MLRWESTAVASLPNCRRKAILRLWTLASKENQDCEGPAAHIVAKFAICFVQNRDKLQLLRGLAPDKNHSQLTKPKYHVWASVSFQGFVPRNGFIYVNKYETVGETNGFINTSTLVEWCVEIPQQNAEVSPGSVQSLPPLRRTFLGNNTGVSFWNYSTNSSDLGLLSVKPCRM
jgi:hypothetical protein